MPTPATDQPRGVRRRTLPLGRLVSATRQQLGSESRRAGDRIMLLLERRNALSRLSRAAEKHETPAAKAARRGPIGRGGHPLSDEHREALEEIFELEEMRAFGSLIRSSTNAFALAVGGVLEDRYLQMYNAGGKAAVQILGARGSFNLRNGFILESLADRANLLSKGFGDELFDRLRTVVAEEFFISGRGPRDVAASLRDEFSFLTQERAELIARTETLAITSEAQFTVYKASGVERKRWLATLDGKERPAHFKLHGQVRDIDEPYEVEDEGETFQLMYPGDPNAEPGMICNCRCDEIPIVTDEQLESDAPVWRGGNDPDEFARDREAA